jgi:hypothetical protein
MNRPVEWPKTDQFGYAFDELSAKDAALRYQRARAEAALQRLAIAVEALAVLRPALWLDLRYASDDDDKDAFLSRARGVDEALALIGPLPLLPELPQRVDAPPALTEEQRALINRVAGEYELRAKGALFPEAYRELRKDAAELRELANKAQP